MKYVYFGGYVGDGNITTTIIYNGTLKSAAMEVAINDNFSLFINGKAAGNYTKGNTSYEPISVDLSPYLASFVSGNNTIEFRNGNIKGPLWRNRPAKWWKINRHSAIP